MKRCASLLLLAGAALPLGIAGAESASLKLLPSGAVAKVGGYAPQRLKLLAERPASITKTPALEAPFYTVLKWGEKSYALVLDEPAGKDAKLYLDSNGNGDLTDDEPTQWTKRPYKGQDGAELTQYQGSGFVHLQEGERIIPVRFGVHRFDKNDPGRAAFKDVVFYYGDYGREGELKVGDKSYKVILHDQLATGDFRGKPSERGSGVSLLIDVDGNGRFDSRGESYDISKPFDIKGTTYEIKNVAISGATLEVVKSSQTAAEILPPPDLSVGQPALAFQAKTTDGKIVSFPGSYKGKLVLLDFWATWCVPCVKELPQLTAAYKTYNPKGLEVLGISLDRPNAEAKLATFTKEKEMPWAQVYDGKHWQAAVADLYVVNSIPSAYLVDGDTGKIIATGNSLRGEQLAQTIEKALADKKTP